MSEWPKRVKCYLHGDKDTNWEIGEENGLSEEAIRENFRLAFYEVTVEIDLNEDGTYKIVSFKE